MHLTCDDAMVFGGELEFREQFAELAWLGRVALSHTGLTLEAGVTDAQQSWSAAVRSEEGYQWQQTLLRSARSGS
jgi:hypothetical protein